MNVDSFGEKVRESILVVDQCSCVTVTTGHSRGLHDGDILFRPMTLSVGRTSTLIE